MLWLTAASLFCLLVLLGGYIYSGSIFPSFYGGASAGEKARVWVLWTIDVGVLLTTGLLWTMRRVDKS